VAEPSLSTGLNATQGSLLGFLNDGPASGWELLQKVEGGLSRFWNVTPSHLYRELRVLERRKLVKAGSRSRSASRCWSRCGSGVTWIARH